MTAGCTSTQTRSPIDRLANQDVAVGTAGGAGLGALIGFGVDRWVLDGDGGTGAAIGAAIGGTVGFAAGTTAAERRRDYDSDQKFLESEIADTERAISDKEIELADAERQFNATKADVDRLVAQHGRNLDVSEAANKHLRSLRQAIDSDNKVLTTYKDTMDYLDEVIKNTDADATATAEERREVLALLDEAKADRATLESQFDRLYNLQQDRLALAKTLQPMAN